jgi:hypothetical protein
MDLDIALGDLRGLFPGFQVSFSRFFCFSRCVAMSATLHSSGFLQELHSTPSTSKAPDAADTQTAVQVPFVGFHDDSDSGGPDHNVTFTRCVE